MEKSKTNFIHFKNAIPQKVESLQDSSYIKCSFLLIMIELQRFQLNYFKWIHTT